MATLISRLRGFRSESGAELIEMAMVTPILALIIAAIVDFGFLFRGWEVVTNAAREGARVGVLPSYNCANGAGGVVGDVESRVQAYMVAAGYPDASVYDIDVDVQDIPTAAGTFSACVVRVVLTQNLPSLSVIGDFFGGDFGTLPVAAAAVMRTETQAAP